MTETKKQTHQTANKTTACKKKTPSKVQGQDIKKKSASGSRAGAQKAETKRADMRSTDAQKERVLGLLALIEQKLDAGKAENIITIDLAGKTSFADYLVIATGTSARHVFGLANNLATDLKKAGYRVQVSGDTGDGNWVVIDAIDVVVHLFTQETRDFYRLEEIWNQKAS